MARRTALTGNDAVAEALRQVNPDVAAVYPITPQTEMMHRFAEFVANGEVDTLLVNVESEHSAMSASIGAAAAGARAITATSSAGLALMWEMTYVASGLRLPIVMANVNRALSGPLNIHCDHSDSMGCRDNSWIQLYVENAQEAYDSIIQAFRIAEHEDVLLPVMVCLDGFILSHTMEVVDLEEDEAVKRFVGQYEPEHYLLKADDPVTMGPIDLQDWLFEHKRQQAEAMKAVPAVVREVGGAFGAWTGRSYDLLEAYRLDDAEVAVVVLGSTAGTAKVAADRVRDEGLRAGVLKLRMFRPFPGGELMEALSGVRAVAVMDRTFGFGLVGGPVFHEVRSAAYEARASVPIQSYVYGIGGRDITADQIAGVFRELAEATRAGRAVKIENYVGLRE